MTFVVPFDGSELAQVALIRAAQFDTAVGEGVVVVSAIPENNTDYAREKGWIDSHEAFDRDAIVTHLREQVAELVSDVEFRYISVDRRAPSGAIAKSLRRFARNTDASIVFIGSKNAGRVVRSISVGSSVATDNAYDSLIISDVRETKIEKFEEEISTEERID